jgi:hypothetical protein
VLAPEQGVHAQTCFRRQLFEAAAFDLMRDEHLALLVRQFVQGRIKLLDQHLPRVGRLGSGVRLRQEVFEQRRLFPGDHSRTVCRRGCLLLAEPICDPIPGDSE